MAIQKSRKGITYSSPSHRQFRVDFTSTSNTNPHFHKFVSCFHTSAWPYYHAMLPTSIGKKQTHKDPGQNLTGFTRLSQIDYYLAS
ncbi:hypothetical protein [Sphingobacterium tabacisoli]|uniref:Uncharacterized protein n=1 Tax=Sphingobacterium tabacisoli TaxID=2044855 RepID=A0ABW5L9X2_9SPHI|nr:hypothetical protein [Sphingobacterium tabacisoli]